MRAHLWLWGWLALHTLLLLAVFGVVYAQAPAHDAAYLGVVVLAVLSPLLLVVRLHTGVLRPLRGLGQEIKLRLAAPHSGPLHLAEEHALGDLPQQLSTLFARQSEDSAAREAQLVGQLARKQAWLAAILHDLNDGIIGCSLDRRVVLYNPMAARLLHADSDLGLGRMLDSFIAPGPVRHSLRLLQNRHARDNSGAAAIETFTVVTRDGTRYLRARMSLLLDPHERAANGFVLDLAAEPFDAATLGAGPLRMSDLLSTDLVEAANALAESHGIEARLTHTGRAVWLHGESFPLTALLKRLLRASVERDGVRALDVRVEAAGPRATLALDGAGLRWDTAALDALIGQSVTCDTGEVPVARIVERHQAALSVGEQGGLRLVLPAVTRRQEGAAPALPARPEFFDLDLLAAGPTPDDLLARRLDALTFVVFDLETTGLAPAQGDRIVQVAGVRVVNKRVLTGETFDELVDPERPIPPTSTRFHGITDAMVRGRPTVNVMLPRFARFCDDAVLVAHNAAFDMAFLRRAQAGTSLRFAPTVIDTLALSAVLHDHTPEHNLDAICARFGVSLRGRHTALGDAMATAEVFVKIIDLLAADGVTTLGEALALSRKASAVRKQQQQFETAD